MERGVVLGSYCVYVLVAFFIVSENDRGGGGGRKTSLTFHVPKTSREPFPYNTHNSAQAKLTTNYCD